MDQFPPAHDWLLQEVILIWIVYAAIVGSHEIPLTNLNFIFFVSNIIISEYTVSYGYGFATALTAYSIWRRCQNVPLLTLHTMALVFYGTRLNLFLAIRSKLSRRIQEFNESVEKKAQARGNRLATRAPFILSCGWLYYGLNVPLVFTSQLLQQSTTLSPTLQTVFRILFGAQWLGFVLAAVGDFTKTWVKQRQQNENFLVRSGILAWIRHPNYTGECIGWTANAMAGMLAAALLVWGGPTTTTASGSNSLSTALGLLGNLTSLLVGWTGILFVLLRATSNLEERQAKDYGNDAKYQSWVESSWSGFQLSSSAAAAASRKPTEDINDGPSSSEPAAAGDAD